jgi:hypothetical protein
MEETWNMCGTYKVWHFLHAADAEPGWSTGAHIRRWFCACQSRGYRNGTGAAYKNDSG